MPINFTLDNLLGQNSSTGIAGALGFDPEKYGQYFGGVDDYNKQMDFIGQNSALATQGLNNQRNMATSQFNQQNQGIGMNAQNTMSSLLGQSNQMYGNSGFSGFGAVQKNLQNSRNSLLQSVGMQRNSLNTGYQNQMGQLDLQGQQQQLGREQGEWNAQNDYYSNIMDVALQLLETGVEQDEQLAAENDRTPLDMANMDFSGLDLSFLGNMQFGPMGPLF